MKLTKVDWRKINTYKPTKLDNVLDEFLAMHTEVAEVTEYANASAAPCYNSFKRAIERRRLHGIEVKVTNGRVYLLNRDLLDKCEED